MSNSTMKTQHTDFKKRMRAHQLTPEWEKENGNVLLAPGITVQGNIRTAKAFREIVLDPESGHYIFLLGGISRQLQEILDHVENLELEKALELLGNLQQALENLKQEVDAVRQEVKT